MAQTDLNTEADNILLLANLYNLQAILNKMKILTMQTNGENQSIKVPVINDNLYNLAAKYYGDALQWTVIAEANNLTDPQINSYQIISIPKWDGIDRGGEFQG